MFVYVSSLPVDGLLEVRALKTPTLNKVLCYPAEQPVKVDAQIEQFCLYSR